MPSKPPRQKPGRSETIVRFSLIPGLPNRFRAGSDGHVYSYRCQLRRLIERLNKDGYPIVDICLNGRKREARVHTLIAEAFLWPRRDGEQIRHLNGDRTDNRPGNLRWGTAQQNAQDRDQHGRTVRGSAARHATITEADVPLIRNLLKSRVLHREIAAMFGTTKFVIDNISAGKTWRHV